jgi:hypothetical protein
VLRATIGPKNVSGSEIVRRIRLHELDLLLTQLENLNLREATEVPEHLSARLRAAGIGYRREESITEVLDRVFRAQEAYLRPGHGTRRWSAA